MGQELVRALHADADAKLVSAVEHEGSVALGVDAAALAKLSPCGVLISADLATAVAGADVVIDFSRASAVASTVRSCAAAKVPLLVGTTGLDPATLSQIEKAGANAPVLVSANTSLALNVLLELVERAARALPGVFDIEILESHHRHKVDAPSGTALALGAAAAQGRDQSLPAAISPTGAKPGAREDGIGFAVVRGGDVVGEHDVRFLGPGEQLRLTHLATDRAIFARGALAAAKWLCHQTPGRYRMADFLFKNQ
jgi:4-hydroxy-tetrahydrodipicolinate reductase